jgi:hypothetical protein
MIDENVSSTYPEGLKTELRQLAFRYSKIRISTQREDKTLQVVNFVSSFLESFLRYYSFLNTYSKSKMEETTSDLIVSILYLDKLHVGANLKPILAELIDLDNPHALQNVNRKALVTSTLRKLRKFKKAP